MDIEASAPRDGGRLKDIRAFIDGLYGHDLTVRTNHIDDTHAFLHGPATYDFRFEAPLDGDALAIAMTVRDDRTARDDATLATTVWCFEQGAALLRVHDVAGSRRAVELLDVIERATPEGMAA